MTPHRPTGPILATVTAVAVFPIKGAGGSDVTGVDLDGAGVIGDRRHVVLDANGAPLTAEQAPALRSVRAGLGPGGVLSLQIPGHGGQLSGPAATHALSALLGQPVQLAAVAPGSQLEAPVHLVSHQAVAAARRGEHRDGECACSLEDPRANVVLDLAPETGPPVRGTSSPSPVGADEQSWVGALVRVGEAQLRVIRRPGHCLGVYAQVVTAGRIETGDLLAAVRPEKTAGASR